MPSRGADFEDFRSRIDEMVARNVIRARKRPFDIRFLSGEEITAIKQAILFVEVSQLEVSRALNE